MSTFMNWLQSWTPTLQVISNTLLTGALVYLYYKQKEIMAEQTEIQGNQANIQRKQADTQQEQTEIQDRQSRIMESQETLLELEYRPKLLIENWYVLANQIYIKLTNIGGGDALELSVHLELLPKNEIYYPNDMDSSEYNLPLYNEDDSVSGQYSNIIESGSSGNYHTKFGEFRPSEQIDRNARTFEFFDISEEIQSDFLEMQIWIKYTDILGKEHINRFTRLSAELPDNDQFAMEEIITESPDIMYFPNSIQPSIN